MNHIEPTWKWIGGQIGDNHVRWDFSKSWTIFKGDDLIEICRERIRCNRKGSRDLWSLRVTVRSGWNDQCACYDKAEQVFYGHIERHHGRAAVLRRLEDLESVQRLAEEAEKSRRAKAEAFC